MWCNTMGKVKTKVAALYGPKKLLLEHWEIPEAKPGYALIRIKSVNICPTDVRKYLGYVNIPVPAVLGHEGAGIIAKLPNKFNDIQEGDKVWICPIISYCGVCRYCVKGQINLCDKLACIGYSGGSIQECAKLQKKGILGLFSEYTIVPLHALLKLPEDVSLDDATFIDPLSCIMKTMEDVKLTTQDNVVIIGCGPMGLLAINVAKVFHAEKIIAVEPLSDRRKLAIELGADNVINPFEEDITSTVQELTDGGADVIIITTGGAVEAEYLPRAIEMAAKGARINIFAGTYPKKEVLIDPNLIHYKEIIISGTFGYTLSHCNKALTLIRKRKVQIQKIRSPVLKFEEIENAFNIYGKPPNLKVGLSIP